MKIAALSEVTGVSVPTLKYYLREGLLPPGVATAVNQAEYDDHHVRRVRLIRALLELGGLSVARVPRSSPPSRTPRCPSTTPSARPRTRWSPRRDRSGTPYEAAMAEVDRFVRRHRLRVREDAAVREMLADALVALVGFGWFADDVPDGRIFDHLVPGLRATAELEVATTPVAERDRQVEHVVVGTVVFEMAAAAVRRMALEHASARRFGRATARRR